MEIVFFEKKKFVRNDFRFSANLYFCPHHSPSISSLIPKNMMDPQVVRKLNLKLVPKLWELAICLVPK